MTNLRFLRSDLEVETINNINDINDINDTNDTNDMASLHLLRGKQAKTSTPAGPRGQAAPEVSPEGKAIGQEAEGLVEIAEPKLTLAEEKKLLIENDAWISQQSIDYVKVSFWLTEPNNPHSIKMKYSFKRTNRSDLKYNGYTVKLTRNRFDYIRNVEAKWPDHQLVTPAYSETAEAMRQVTKLGGIVYAGKAQKTRTYSRGIQKIPMEPCSTTTMWHNNDEDAWTIDIQHHDFKLTLEYPTNLWAEELQTWINKWATLIESRKHRGDVPPFVSIVWRAI